LILSASTVFILGLAFFALQFSPVVASSHECDGKAATIIGTNNGEVIRGTNGDDVIVARGGNDRIFAKGGNDTICAGNGYDFVNAGSGDDVVFGEAGKDYIKAGSGQDTIHGGNGGDVVKAGSGDDVVFGGDGRDFINGQGGNDSLLGQGGRNVLVGGWGKDICSVGDGGRKYQCEFETSTMIVEKQTIPDGAIGNFSYTGDVVGSIGDNEQIVVDDVLPGTYSTTEASPTPGFDLTSIVCDDGGSHHPSITDLSSLSATFEVDLEETVTCVFTNTQRGTIELTKGTDPSGGTGFGFTEDITPGGAMVLDDGQTVTFSNVVPGTYTVVEDDPTPAFDLTGLTCVDSDGSGVASTASIATRTARVNLDPGETVSCTFSNTERGTIEIVKSTDPVGGTGFGFTDDVAAPNNFTLDDGQTQTFTDVVPGTYTVTENDPTPAADLTGLVCVDSDAGGTASTADVATRSATINVDPGETVTCTFTNTERGTINIVKSTDPAGGAGFGFTDDIAAPNAFALDHGQTETFADVVPGTFTVAEDDPGTDYELTGLVCVDSDAGGTASTADVAARTATINVDPGETVTCTFTNTLQLGAIGGYKFEDLNGNGVDDADPPLPGVIIRLTGTDDLGNPVDLMTTTGADGEYWFMDLRPGTYTVTEDPPAEVVPTTPPTVSLTVAPGTEYVASASQATTGSFVVVPELAIGNTVLASLHGLVFDDANADGVYSPADGDTPQSGAEVRLKDSGGSIIATTTTAGSGEFGFTGLMPGTYAVEFVVLPGRVPTTPTSRTYTLQSREELVWAAGAAGLPAGSLRVEVVVGNDLTFGSAALDFGDLADPTYPTLLASNGPRHVLGVLFMGAAADAEPDGQPTVLADGDDLNFVDDEDGVVFSADVIIGATGVPIEVSASGPGLLDAWVDFNGDGDFADAGEQIFVSTALVAGANSLTFDVPGAAAAGTTGARFRLSSAGGLSPTGLAVDGEVEDYLVTLADISLDIEKYTNGNQADGPNDPDVPIISAGDPVTWTYEVENTGLAPVPGGDVVVTDNRLGVIAGPSSGDNGNGILDPGEIWIYEATGTSAVMDVGNVAAVPGTCDPTDLVYSNLGTVSVTGTPLDSDPSHYCGFQPPEVVPDFYTALGNVDISVDAANGLILGAGADLGGPGLTVTEVEGAGANVGVATPTDEGGSVTVQADGSLVYEPLTGFTGVDTFDYVVSNASGPSAPGVVSITVSDLIWFVDASALPGGDGSLDAPFTCLTGPGCYSGAAADPGDAIHLADGSYNEGVTLLDGQALVGDGTSVSLDSALGIVVPPFSDPLPPLGGADPVITSTSNGINLGSDNRLRGLTIGNTTGTGIAGTTVGNLTVSEADVVGAGKAIDINGGTLAVDLDVLQVTPSGSSGGVSLVNTGGTTTFGSVNVAVMSGAAFEATNAGTINIGGTANTLSTDSGGALLVSNTTIGTGGWTFQSISATNAAKGISLSNTGTEGLTVTGVGTTDGSGGTISTMVQRGVEAISVGSIDLSNMNFVSANTGDAGGCGGFIAGSENQSCNAGIHLQSVGTTVLTNLDLSGAMSQQGINGNGLTSLTLEGVSVTGAGNGVNEGGVRLSQVSGTLAVSDSTFSFSSERNFYVFNNFGSETTLTATITNSTFSDTQSSGLGADGLEIELRGLSNLNADITGNQFLRNRTNAVQVLAQDSGSDVLSLDITGNTMDVDGGIGKAIDLAAANGASLTFNVIGNPVLTSDGGTVVNVAGFGSATVEGRINTNADIQTGAMSAGNGIKVAAEEAAQVVVEIDGNTVSNIYQDNGIQLLSRSGSGRLDVTVNNNGVSLQGGAAFPLYGIETRAQDSNTVCANLTNNSVTPGSALAAFRARTADGGATLYLQGFTVDATTTWTANGNTGAPVSDNQNGTLGGATCTTVSHPLP
jgi:plastocyanin